MHRRISHLLFVNVRFELEASIMDRFGLLSLIVIGATNMAMAGTIRSFPKEKAIVSVELVSAFC